MADNNIDGVVTSYNDVNTAIASLVGSLPDSSKFANKTDLDKYLPLSGGTLTGQTSLSAAGGTDSVLFLLQNGSNNAYLSVANTDGTSYQQIGVLDKDAARIGFGATTDSFKTRPTFVMDTRLGGLRSPSSFFLWESGSNDKPRRRYTFRTTAVNTQYIAFPIAFSSDDDVFCTFTANYVDTKGTSISPVITYWNNSVPNRYGVTLSIASLLNSQPLITTPVSVDISVEGYV